jgi:hypothetical protein
MASPRNDALHVHYRNLYLRVVASKKGSSFNTRPEPSFFCCLDAQNGLTFAGQPARVFRRFPLAARLAEFGRLSSRAHVGRKDFMSLL